MRLGVAGLGVAARQMLPSLAAHSHVRITAAADSRSEARELFERDYGGQAFETLEALCDSPLVDAVYIATPSHLHARHCITAAQRGKHVLVEKPMALTLRECDDMIEATNRNHVGLVVGHTHAFDAPVRKMARLIGSGEFGALGMINTWNYNDYICRPRWPHELHTESGGGIIYNQVPHQVDIVRLLGGGLVQSVRSMAWILDDARPTEGSQLTFMQFESGAAASMAFSGYDYFDSDEFHFWIGENGEDKREKIHGSSRSALMRMQSREEELDHKKSMAYGAAAYRGSASGPARDAWHQPHFGITIASCAKGDLRLSGDGVIVYGREGRTEVLCDRGRAFPDRDKVADELYSAFAHGTRPALDGSWGKASLEVCLAILTSARERREVRLAHQVAMHTPLF